MTQEGPDRRVDVARSSQLGLSWQLQPMQQGQVNVSAWAPPVLHGGVDPPRSHFGKPSGLRAVRKPARLGIVVVAFPFVFFSVLNAL